jgi:hypothetical protein
MSDLSKAMGERDADLMIEEAESFASRFDESLRELMIVAFCRGAIYGADIAVHSNIEYFDDLRDRLEHEDD